MLSTLSFIFALSHFTTSKWPLAAASPMASGPHSPPLLCSHLTTSRCPPAAAKFISRKLRPPRRPCSHCTTCKCPFAAAKSIGSISRSRTPCPQSH
ncbi:hypothetical protein PF005_g30510 [Phytophthora fragariae]|uniref:Secreted protein n=1 Tax=Phytophthora fragariae TaxID=53985 RepID=A0A6A3DBP0_9STRA|nr:hypothetical protein PF003_g39570 [Phytophthora fragariae]KAE8918952.1 hypothetical protein PF009_g30734 [Phytophthora fragariae]KAE9061561.1 hypothetical protein PF007_g30213 [Phytophthora fragariae]KAE9066420.1 hypothetical protein PF006_g30243 [Phytophthora fragariae]KAE9163288.1 hypothetical protein PF005_g30510 [Phytophthora fragariae]